VTKGSQPYVFNGTHAIETLNDMIFFNTNKKYG
jgi:hypothetical protein